MASRLSAMSIESVPPQIVEKIEEIDPERRCVLYWEGRQERNAIKAGLAPERCGCSSLDDSRSIDVWQCM